MLRTFPLVALFCCVGAIAFSPRVIHAQSESLEKTYLKARGKYYTPTAGGFRGLTCTVTADWKDMLTRFSGQAVADDNAFLAYLNGWKMSADDNVYGKGVLTIAEAAPAPKGLETNAQQMKDGIRVMFSGFYQSWNPYMNGGMVPIPDKTTTVVEDGPGYKLHASSKEYDVSESFDKDWLLSGATVVVGEKKVIKMEMSYAPSPEGLVIQKFHVFPADPNSDAGDDMTVDLRYAVVNSFQLPSKLRLSVKNTAYFDFGFTDCTVEKSELN